MRCAPELFPPGSSAPVRCGVRRIALGSWYGYGRGWKHAEEEVRWAREQAKARRTHPAYRPEVAHEAWTAHEDQALTLANERVILPRLGTPIRELKTIYRPEDEAPITTGEIQAITDETDIMVARWKADNDLWMAEHGLSDT